MDCAKVNAHEWQTVGVDFGTSFTRIAQLDNVGTPALIPNRDGETKTPSIVLLGDDGHVKLGESLDRKARQEDMTNFVAHIKRQLGSDVYWLYQNKKLTVKFISALILKKLKQDAERRLGTISHVVLAAPFFFDDKRRKALRDAARIAGLKCVEIVDELQAATLAHAWSTGGLGFTNRDVYERPILVLSLGGGTFEVAVVKYTASQTQILARGGVSSVGGIDWTALTMA